MVPIEAKMPWNTAHDYTREIAERLAATAPGKYTTSAAFSARPGKVFIDYLRNGRGTTAIGAYSPRTRPGFPVAAPVTWREVEHGVRPDAFSMAHPPPRTNKQAIKLR
jgi:bifunctional non-homologous end joining protein LigD